MHNKHLIRILWTVGEPATVQLAVNERRSIADRGAAEQMVVVDGTANRHAPVQPGVVATAVCEMGGGVLQACALIWLARSRSQSFAWPQARSWSSPPFASAARKNDDATANVAFNAVIAHAPPAPE